MKAATKGFQAKMQKRRNEMQKVWIEKRKQMFIILQSQSRCFPLFIGDRKQPLKDQAAV
jgi:hypothetical protein